MDTQVRNAVLLLVPATIFLFDAEPVTVGDMTRTIASPTSIFGLVLTALVGASVSRMAVVYARQFCDNRIVT